MTGGFVGISRFISHPFKGSPAFCRSATCLFSPTPKRLYVQVHVCACVEAQGQCQMSSSTALHTCSFNMKGNF